MTSRWTLTEEERNYYIDALKEYHPAYYPGKADWMTQLMESTTGKGSYLDEQLRLTLGELYEPMMLLKNINQHNAIQARIPFEMNIK